MKTETLARTHSIRRWTRFAFVVGVLLLQAPGSRADTASVVTAANTLIAYNGPFDGATPMFIGTEPPDYYSIGTDLASAEKAVAVGTINGTTTYLVSYPYNSSSGTHRAPERFS